MAKESLLDRLRSKSTDALDEEGKLRKELLELKIKHSSGQLKETHKIREIRRSIAQLKTLNKEQKVQELEEKNDG
jgi:large subunit ribosomal protein L29